MYIKSRGTRMRPPTRRAALGVLAAVGLVVAAVSASPSSAHPEEADDGLDDTAELSLPSDLSSALEETDFSSNVISDGSFADVTKDLDVVGRGSKRSKNVFWMCVPARMQFSSHCTGTVLTDRYVSSHGGSSIFV